MYLRDAKQKMMDFETKLEDLKSKLLMSDECRWFGFKRNKLELSWGQP